MTRLMALVVTGVVSMASMTQARAEPASCGAWVTSFGTLAGEGEAWNAHLCVEKTKADLEFEITCSAKSLNIRFMPSVPDGEDFGDGKTTITYAIDGKDFPVTAQLEELDGAFATDLPASDPLVEAMKSGKTAVMTFKDRKLPAFTAPLKGAKAALNKLIQKCN